MKKIETTVSEGLEAIEDERIKKGEKYRKTVYAYPRYGAGGEYGQASNDLLVEVNNFTNPEPANEMQLQTLVAEMLATSDRDDLIKQFDLVPFPVLVLSVRRTLVEKILGAVKDSYHDDPAAQLSKRIRHLYDICLILREVEHSDFLGSEDFASLCESCIADERVLFEDTAPLFDIPLGEAPLFSNFEDWRPSIEAIYNTEFQKSCIS
ncbi:nucleotidyl transferase AbiEii/AbiGii toxin family protein [Emcibacter nanhaiensis]|uniref:Nucleotidyl transferase AbiEii/AbiGii toxin family protein n=1 Tax=Emcibacter nanhaiensis TaxID=1505037 RepID=A0A501PJG1_9PROT|nr:nucleotidyl transferase AbiEii/AbiGii toxin family protein [Emcibacter nanhaiensis]